RRVARERHREPGREERQRLVRFARLDVLQEAFTVGSQYRHAGDGRQLLEVSDACAGGATYHEGGVGRDEAGDEGNCGVESRPRRYLRRRSDRFLEPLERADAAGYP